MDDPINSQIAAHSKLVSSRRLRIFSLYVDFPGSVCARWVNATISQATGLEWIISAEVWNLGSLGNNPSIRIMTTGEAARADILSVTISSFSYSQHELLSWLEVLAQCQSERLDTGLLIGYFGDEEHNSREINCTVKQFMNCAKTMDREFVWQQVPAGLLPDQFWLRNQLKTFLNRKRAVMDKTGAANSPPTLTALTVLPVLAA